MTAQDAAQTSTACERTTAFADSATAAVVDSLADSATKKLNTHTVYYSSTNDANEVRSLVTV